MKIPHPHPITLPPIGLRMAKTALSVSLCLLLAQLASYPTPTYACVAAVIVTRETVERSFRQGVERVVATLIGGAVALALLFVNLTYSRWWEIPLVGVGVLLALYVCLLLGAPDAAALAAVTVLIIVLGHPANKYLFALTRVGETVAGICVSLAVNRFIGKPKVENGGQESGDSVNL